MLLRCAMSNAHVHVKANAHLEVNLRPCTVEAKKLEAP